MKKIFLTTIIALNTVFTNGMFRFRRLTTRAVTTSFAQRCMSDERFKKLFPKHVPYNQLPKLDQFREFPSLTLDPNSDLPAKRNFLKKVYEQGDIFEDAIDYLHNLKKYKQPIPAHQFYALIKFQETCYGIYAATKEFHQNSSLTEEQKTKQYKLAIRLLEDAHKDFKKDWNNTLPD